MPFEAARSDAQRRSALPAGERRTWSTNTGHLRLLEQIGIAEVLRLPDHRGTGIDTLYLARAPRNRPETA